MTGKKFWTTLIIVIALALGAALAFQSRYSRPLPDDVALLLGEARKANFSHDIEEEKRILEHAEGLEGSAEDLAEVQRRLAVLDWKYHSRFESARERLLRAADGADPAEAWLALARLDQARERFDAAGSGAQRALETAETEDERRRSRIALGRAAIGEAVALRLQGKVGQTDALRATFDDLRDLVGREPGYLEPSRLLLQSALLVDRGEAALLAWRSYYHVAPGHPIPNAVADSGRELTRLLPGWKGKAAAAEDRVGLIEALAGSRFFTEAMLIALDPRGPIRVRENARVGEILAYARTVRQVRRLTTDYYREVILGEGDPDRFEDRIQALGNAVVLEMEGIDPDDPPAEDDLVDLLGERFGSYISLGKTAGYFDLHMGHRVVDETRTVDQYGHRAELRFVVLDHMVSNGFQSWAWESGAQHGGWARPDVIYQVRPPYVDGPLETWRKIHTPEEKDEFLEEMDRQSGLDDDRARLDPYASLPGLALRLRHQGTLQVLQRLQSEGFAGDELRLAFLAVTERAIQDSSIFAHEGRHAIEKRRESKYQSGWRAEFTAKLSEVAFAPEPRLAFGGILTPSIGDDTPHGKANLKIMKGLVAWMEEHREAIAELDPDRPLLPQLDLLTDEQLQAAFRGMDPLATGQASQGLWRPGLTSQLVQLLGTG